MGINDLDLQFAAAAAAAGYFEPDVSAFTIGFESSELYISSVFQGESVGSLRADLGKVITSSPLCFHSTCLYCSPLALGQRFLSH